MSLIETLRRDGFVVARDVLSQPEVADLRERFAVIGRRARCDRDSNYPRLSMPRGDALSHEELRELDYVILDPRIVGLARELLGRVAYHGDSSVQIGDGPRGFHKDNADRGNPAGIDWQGEYGLVRMAVYLQDHAEHSGGLKVRTGSHRYVSHHRGRALNVASRAGDVVFWYLTTSHSGNAVRLAAAPWLAIHPRIESLVPAAFRVREQSERRTLFCTFGAPGRHLDRYVEYQRGRADMRGRWPDCGRGAHLDRLARDRGVELLRPSWNDPLHELGAGSSG